MLKSCRQLSMTVRSPNLPTPSQPPPPPPSSSGPWLLRQTYSWMDRQGRPVSPPLEYARASPPVLVAPPPPPPRWTYSRSNKEKAIRKVSNLRIKLNVLLSTVKYCHFDTCTFLIKNIFIWPKWLPHDLTIFIAISLHDKLIHKLFLVQLFEQIHFF